MARWGEQQYGTYRCPVCGYRDGTVLERDEERGLVVCTYCETPLAVSSRGYDSVHFSVQVAEERAGW